MTRAQRDLRPGEAPGCRTPVRGGTSLTRAQRNLRPGEAPGCRTPTRGGAFNRSGARGPRQARWVDRSSPRAHKCTIEAHHWGGRAHRRRKRRHRRLTFYTSAPYSTTIRSFARSLARQCALTAHHWGGRGSQARHTPPSLARSLTNSCLTAHHWGGRGRGRATLHHRSPDRSPIQVSRLTTGDGGSPLGNKATQVYYRDSLLGRGHMRRKRRHRRLHKCTILNHHSFVRSLILSLASALSRLTTGEGRVHTGRHTQPPFVARSLARQIHCHTVRPFARSFANSRLALATGEREITHGRHRSLVCSPTHGSTLGNEATQVHSQGSPLGREGS